MASSVRIRFPEIVFRASTNGYNLQNFYNSVDEFVDTYHYCVILIKTADGDVFGAFLDVIPDSSKKEKFVGTSDCFVFSLKPTLVKYPALISEYVALFDPEYFSIGSKGAGPALRVDDLLKMGSSYESATFGNQSLMSKPGLNCSFEIVEMEVLIV